MSRLDPSSIGFAGGDVNLYGYVQNNPVNFVDPSGLIAPRFIPNWGKGPRWPNYPTSINVNWNLLVVGVSTIAVGATIAQGGGTIAATSAVVGLGLSTFGTGLVIGGVYISNAVITGYDPLNLFSLGTTSNNSSSSNSSGGCP